MINDDDSNLDYDPDNEEIDEMILDAEVEIQEELESDD